MASIDPAAADEKLEAMLATFGRTGEPVNVSFREILQTKSTRDRATHDLHPYPARLLVNIPEFFLSTNLSRPSGVLLDPFCGSGTVLLEAILMGRSVTGADSNPLARLLTRTKLTPLDPHRLRSTRRSLFQRLPSLPRRDYPKVLNIDYWFYPHVRHELLRLWESIGRIQDQEVRDFFSITFSSCIKDVSLADPRLSVPVRLKKDQYPKGHWLHEKTNDRLSKLCTIDVNEVFRKRLDDNIRRIERLASWPRLGSFIGLSSDARSLSHLDSNSVGLTITSPPYLGAQKYIRASSLNLTWLELCAPEELRSLEDKNIGREHYPKAALNSPVQTGISNADALLGRIRELNPLRAHIAANYFCEMREAIREIIRVLAPKAHFVLVAGASHVCGICFPTPLVLTEIAIEEGLALRLHIVDPIRSRALMTKRHHTAGRIDAESILLFQKDI